MSNTTFPRSLREFLAAHPLRHAPDQHQNITSEWIEDILEDSDFDLTDWGDGRFRQVARFAATKPGHESLKSRSAVHQAQAVLLDLETALRELYPALSASNLISFWRSRQVHDYLRRSVTAPLDEMPGALDLIRRALNVYTESLQPSLQREHPASPKLKRSGRTADASRHLRVCEIVQQHEPRWKSALDDICFALDDAKVPICESWREMGSDWADVLAHKDSGGRRRGRDLIVKAIQDSLCWKQKHPAS